MVTVRIDAESVLRQAQAALDSEVYRATQALVEIYKSQFNREMLDKNDQFTEMYFKIGQAADSIESILQGAKTEEIYNQLPEQLQIIADQASQAEEFFNQQRPVQFKQPEAMRELETAFRPIQEIGNAAAAALNALTEATPTQRTRFQYGEPTAPLPSSSWSKKPPSAQPKLQPWQPRK